MLYRETVEPDTLELLIALMQFPELTDYRLVGGTALSLQFGHRKSIDLDFFGLDTFQVDSFRKSIRVFNEVNAIRVAGPIFQFVLNSIKVDIVEYPYPWIEPTLVDDNITMATDREIAAMKVNAITNRGTKKDFVDLYALLLKYSFSEIISFYTLKYPDGNKMLALRSLNYFADADDQDVEILWDVTWDEMKSTIAEKYIKYFESL